MHTSSLLRSFWLSALTLAAIVWLSLTSYFPEVKPLRDVPFYDKWAHFLMYGCWTTIIWWEYWRYRKHHSSPPFGKMLILAIVIPTAVGGLLELAQAYLTTYRSGDWMDFLANTVGVLIGTALGLLVQKR